jgi:hypothetical protein
MECRDIATISTRSQVQFGLPGVDVERVVEALDRQRVVAVKRFSF